MGGYLDDVRRHFEGFWGLPAEPRGWAKGPEWKLPMDFNVLEVAPKPGTVEWRYATCGMSGPSMEYRLEVFCVAPAQDGLHVELMTVIANYWRSGTALDVGHTVPIGRPWLPGSALEFVLFSLPYIGGPKLEALHRGEGDVRVLWVIPITEAEKTFRHEQGLEALEQRFEEAGFNYIDPNRASVA